MLLEEADEKVDDAFESLKNGLLEASENLNNLADFCEQSFKEPEIVPDRPLTADNAKLHGPFGSEELIETGEFAVQALNAIAFNVCSMAELLEAKMANLGQNLDHLSHDIAMIASQAKIYDQKASLQKMKVGFGNQAQFKKAQNGKKAWKYQPRSYKHNEVYQRTPINYDDLDHIGRCYQPNESIFAAKPKEIPDEAKEENLVPKVPAIFYKPLEEKFATSQRRPKMSKLKNGQMPTIPNRESAHLRRQNSRQLMLEGNNHDVMRLSLLPPMPDLDIEAKNTEEEEEEEKSLSGTKPSEAEDELERLLASLSEDLRKF